MAVTPMTGLLVALSIAALSPSEKPQPTVESTRSTQSVDDYLFERYLLTPKRDRYGEFASKDPKAAEFLGMTLKEYTIGCVYQEFKLTLYVLFIAMEEAGLSPGITAAFRDDYRQQLIVKGIRANVGNSYHGGSKRGGCHNGKAVDVVSIDGRTRAEQEKYSEKLWHWIDTNGKKYGVVRCYGDKDAPHIVPIVSTEYTNRHTRVAHAGRHKHKVHLAKHGKHRKRFAGHKNSARG